MALPLLNQRGRSGENLTSRLRPNTYLTDESRLYRFLSYDRSLHPEPTVLVEDCATLEVIVYPLSELIAADLRVVEPDRSAEPLSRSVCPGRPSLPAA
jgi:hypothetical protein